MIKRLISPWVAERTPITSQMINDMEQLLPEVALLFTNAQSAANRVDLEFRKLQTKHRIRQSFEQRSRELQSLAQLRRLLDRAPSSTITATATIKDVTNSYSPSKTISLVAGSRFDLASWLINRVPLKLHERNRYLCINEDNGRIGWARIVHTRITFVARKLTQKDAQIAGRPCHLQLEADWSKNPMFGRNAKVEVRTTDNRKVCQVSIGFNTEKITVLDVRSLATRESAKDKLVGEWIEWIDKNREIFANEILTHFTSPFLYKDRLYGSMANEFFGPIGTRVLLRVVLMNDRPLLTSRSVR